MIFLLKVTYKKQLTSAHACPPPIEREGGRGERCASKNPNNLFIAKFTCLLSIYSAVYEEEIKSKTDFSDWCGKCLSEQNN